MRKKLWLIPLIPIAIVLFSWIFGEIVMHLWNWLTPMLFGLHAITFWQAFGLLLLCRILFGGFGHNGGRGRSRLRERWEKTTPEEREKMRLSWRARCGPFGAPPSAPPATGGGEPA
jgi:hypothetical protein